MRPAGWGVALVATAFVMASCGGAEDAAPECAVGSVGCDCTSGGACDVPLTCIHGKCVEDPLDCSNGVLQDGDACDDGDPCTYPDTCNGTACDGTSYSCDDGISCTTDTCDGSGGCDHQPVAAWCVIDGACVGDGDVSPTDSCSSCQPGVDPVSWSPATGGACDDANLCTFGDTCVAGTCVGTGYSCNDGLACTIDACDGFGGCTATPAAGYCVIAGSCYAHGAPNPANPCLACDATNPLIWSPTSGNACNDGNACTMADVCTAGVCQGTAYSCNDGLSCTIDACDGSGGCSSTIASGTCLIAGACYANGAPNPSNVCLYCNPAVPTSWSYSSSGTVCNDGNACTAGDHCVSGVCSGTPATDGYESNDTAATAVYLGSIGDGDSFPSGTVTASLYGTGDLDWFRYADNDTWLGAIYPRATLTVPTGSDYRLCAYFVCDSGTASVSCVMGQSSSSVIGGQSRQGCCSNAAGSGSEAVELNPSCSGSLLDDSGQVYVLVQNVTSAWSCASYTLQWGDN